MVLEGNMEFDYVKIITWIVFAIILITLAKKLWDLITGKQKKKEKWNEYLEE